MLEAVLHKIAVHNRSSVRFFELGQNQTIKEDCVNGYINLLPLTCPFSGEKERRQARFTLWVFLRAVV